MSRASSHEVRKCRIHLGRTSMGFKWWGFPRSSPWTMMALLVLSQQKSKPTPSRWGFFPLEFPWQPHLKGRKTGVPSCWKTPVGPSWQMVKWDEDSIGYHGDSLKEFNAAKPTGIWVCPKIWDTGIPLNWQLNKTIGFSATLCSEEIARVQHKSRHGRQNSSVLF